MNRVENGWALSFCCVASWPLTSWEFVLWNAIFLTGALYRCSRFFRLESFSYEICVALVLHLCWRVPVLNLLMFACCSYLDKLLDPSESGNGMCHGHFLIALKSSDSFSFLNYLILFFLLLCFMLLFSCSTQNCPSSVRLFKALNFICGFVRKWG